MARIEFRHATRIYSPGGVPAVDGLDLEIADGEFLVLVGPSGCGKSTSLRMLAGLERVDDGSIFVGDRDVTSLHPKDRDIAMVFQNYALYPHMTVAENMAFALKVAGASKADIVERVTQAARLLDLEQLVDRKPKALSGGQRQRVAMGRAIVRQPQAFLMDEPLSNLDAKLRVQTRTQIAALQRRLGTTTVYVTHDQVEAMTMGDRVAVLAGGILQQVGTPRELFDAPANVFVAGFIGSPGMNLVELDVVDGGAVFAGHHIPIERRVLDDATRSGARSVTVGFRPEDIHLGDGDGDGIELDVQIVEELGADAYVYGEVAVSDREPVPLVVRADGRAAIAKGATLTLRPHLDHIHVFASGDGRRLSAAS